MTIRAAVAVFLTSVAYLAIFRDQAGVVFTAIWGLFLVWRLWAWQTWPRRAR